MAGRKAETSTLGRNVARERGVAGLSRLAVAEALGIDVSVYGRIETNDVTLSAERAKRLAELFGVPIDRLYDSWSAQQLLEALITAQTRLLDPELARELQDLATNLLVIEHGPRS